MNYLLAHYCAAFAHSVPAYTRHAVSLLSNSFILLRHRCRLAELVSYARCPPSFPQQHICCLLLSYFIAEGCIIYSRMMNFLYQPFQQDAILFLSLLHMEYDLAINHSTGSDPHSTIGADNKLLFVQTASSFYWFRFSFSLLYDFFGT